MTSTVLVTGGSGYLASHILVKLLKEGYNVRTTIRSWDRRQEVVDMMKNGGVDPGNKLSFYTTDLNKDEGWKDAIEGCKYVLHVASPLFIDRASNDDEFIRPAVDGTLRVLRVARDSNVERVVFTSSFGTISYGHRERGSVPFDETVWSNVTKSNTSAYVKSKTYAEKAAWDFIEKEGGNMELSVINPTGIFGPVLSAKLGPSVQLLKKLLDGSLKACPKITIGMVDVRDTADAHLRAMTEPKAAGQRYIVSSGRSASFYQIGQVFKQNFGDKGFITPSYEIPDWVVWVFSFFSPQAAQALPMLGQVRNASIEKAKKDLEFKPRDWEQTVVDTAQSMIEFGGI